MVKRSAPLSALAVVATAVALAAPATTGAATAPNKAWRGSFKVYRSTVTVDGYRSGKIRINFTSNCSFGTATANLATVATGPLSGSSFNIAAATTAPGTTVDSFSAKGKVTAKSATGTVSVVYGRDIAGVHHTCSLTDTFTAKRLKHVPKV